MPSRFAVYLALVALAARLPAQLTVSTIRGTVSDASGAAVVGANITLVNLDTNIQRIVKANESGDFEIPDLLRGTYRLTASQSGFKSWVAVNIILESNQIRRIDVALELGTASTEVTVRADVALISTESAKIQSSFTNKRFDDAPLVGDGRNPQMVLTTLPLVVNTGGVYGIQVSGQSMRIARPVVIRDPISGSPFPGNVIPASRLNATALAVEQKYIPAPNLGGADALANNYGFLFPYPGDAWHVDYNVERIDHKLTANNTIYGRWIFARLSYLNAASYPALETTQIRHTHHFLVEDTNVFSPRLVQSFRFALYKAQFTWGEEVNGFKPANGNQVVQELGIQGVNP